MCWLDDVDRVSLEWQSLARWESVWVLKGVVCRPLLVDDLVRRTTECRNSATICSGRISNSVARDS